MAFEKNEYTLRVFTDFSKVFDTASHSLLQGSYSSYDTNDRNYAWIKSYPLNRISVVISEYHLVKYGVPKGFILGPRLFMLNVNDLKNASSFLNTVMFEEDTNLFYTRSNIQKLFSMVNEELGSINQYPTSNKLSLNAKKKIFFFFSINSVKKVTSHLMLLTKVNHQ